MSSYAKITDHVKAVSYTHLVYEDNYLVVINKPAGMLSVPGKGEIDSVYQHIKIPVSYTHLLVTLTEQVMKNTLIPKKVLNLTSFHLKVVLH